MSSDSSSRSSLATPIPLRATPSPPAFDTSSTSPNNPDGEALPSILPSSPSTFSGDRASRNPFSVDSSPSSPSSSTTSASVSFTLAPLSPSSLSLAPFSSFPRTAAPQSPTSSAAATTGSRSTTASAASILSSPSHSAIYSSVASPSTALSASQPRNDEFDEPEEGSKMSSPDVEQASVLLSALGLSASSRTPSHAEMEEGEVPEESPVISRASMAPLPSSPRKTNDDISSAPTQSYVPLPDIEIHPSSFSASPRQDKPSVSHNADAIHLGSLKIADPNNDPALSPLTEENLGPKTPNVYINGLPPHFPEDQLFELAAPFGQIRSVRSFTRHVGEKESGYGFVLFQTVDAAEKCILSLRRFRNLHPTFSKQVHKIPGTPYAQVRSDDGSSSSLAGWDQESGKDDESRDVTFKGKMERLHDPNSTNLYIEGLPLSIDEPSLIALVSPHRIKSSRFFQTRLSNPPRIIAFVRLETRTGAEEVVERLHGRMVRGWNDPGSRISVRFADTSEQRELRRNERSVREGDQSPARITIAQAALLNLRGREQLRPTPHGALPPSESMSSLSSFPSSGRLSNSTSGYTLSSSSSYSDFAPNAHDVPINLPSIHAKEFYPQNPVNASYNRYAPLPPAQLPPRTPELSPQMAALLESLRSSGIPLDSYTDGNNFQPNAHHRQYQNAQTFNGNMNTDRPPHVGGVAQARNGYTPTEEYILQSHAANTDQRRRPNRLDLAQAQARAQAQQQTRLDPSDTADFNVGMRGYRAQASTVPLGQRQQQSYGEHRAEGEFNGNVGLGQGKRMGANLLNARATRERETIQHSPQEQQMTFNTASQQPSSATRNQAHLRSTTLPHTNPASSVSANAFANHGNQQSRHYHHNSMSIPKTRSIGPDSTRPPHHSQHHQKHRSTTSISSIDTQNDNNNTKNMYSNGSNFQGKHNGGKNGEKASYDARQCSTLNTAYPHDLDAYDAAQTSPSLVSPALTYSSRGSAPSLSPSTPFIGTFPQERSAEVLQARGG